MEPGAGPDLAGLPLKTPAMSADVALFLIESGKPLELVQAYIAQKKRVRAQTREFAQELGVSRVYLSRQTGALLGVHFDGPRHPDFRLPTRQGVSFPRKASAWAQRLAAAHTVDNPVEVISQAFAVPLVLFSTSQGGGSLRGIGMPLAECGFLYLRETGPYALWTPNVEGEVRRLEQQGERVLTVEPGYTVRIEGARRITQEQWDFLVAQAKAQCLEKAASRRARRQVSA